MAASSTTTHAPANAVVDEAVRITAEGARRSTETAAAALQQTRSYFDHAAEFNRDVFALWSDSANAWLKMAFDVQNAAIANTQSWFNTSSSITKTAMEHYAELMQKTQATTLKTYQAGAKFMSAALHTSE